MTTENPYQPPNTKESQIGKSTWWSGCGLVILVYFLITLFLIPLTRFVWRALGISSD